jgi:hypothetical protein
MASIAPSVSSTTVTRMTGRCGRSVFLEECLYAADSRHDQIHEHEIEALLPDLLYSFFSGGCLESLVALGSENLLQNQPVDVVIVNNKYAAHMPG